MPGTIVTGALFMHDLNASSDSELKIGSLFAGYGGLDLAVEHVFNAKTVWFSDLNEPVARVFSHHWPDVPNLGDITAIDWSRVQPVDILIGGFPCQDVSTVGKRAGLAPGTRSGLWAHMAAAIDALQPEWVVIENVRGLLSSPAIRPPAEGDDHDRRNPGDATPDGATLVARDDKQHALVRGRGVEWVRPTDLIARHSAHAAGRGLDFQAELARRTRTPIGAGVRRLGDRARRLPPISAFGRSTAPAPQVSRCGVSMS